MNNREEILYAVRSYVLLADQRLGILLKKKRIQLGVSQEYVSLETSIDRMGISEMENGKANPTLFILLKLCCAFHIKLWKVLKEINV